jgi:hypothetical protein
MKLLTLHLEEKKRFVSIRILGRRTAYALLVIHGVKQSVHGCFCTYGCAPTISKALK